MPLPPAKQLMLVVTDGWNNLKGTIYCFEKHQDKWILKFSNSVVVGSKGMGIGDGLVSLSISNAPVKKEGDMKAPAGFFTIGTAFGYADYKDAKWIKNPYVKATDTLICVDDMHSAHYNTLVNNDPAKSDWNSFEHMHLKKEYYKWGLFINHNSPNVKPGVGSCIFMHIWENDHEGTAGCTAMTEANLLRILHWINAGDSPLLVQLPKKEYVKIRKEFDLPEVAF
ncbi:MAG: L,D-transpeptidase catalytic domain [Mucilaginibacter sp.]|nr:L,D-transpeptidase catalytic domain [Mucilaginibacter sp.]